VTENEILRERLEKIGDLCGRRIRVDSLENENHQLKQEVAALKAEIARLRTGKVVPPWQ
jgi:cell division protein FtsB